MSGPKESLPIIKICLAVSVVILSFLFWLIYFHEGAAGSFSWVQYLPTVNASLNFCTSVFLVVGYYFIKQGKKQAHINAMMLATLTSALFLVSYLIYHYYQGDTKFIAEGAIRYLYFFILISHILLSIVQIPLILLTHVYAWLGKFESHRKVAPWTFFIWLYVSVTGILVYFFIKYLNN